MVCTIGTIYIKIEKILNCSFHGNFDSFWLIHIQNKKNKINRNTHKYNYNHNHYINHNLHHSSVRYNKKKQMKKKICPYSINNQWYSGLFVFILILSISAYHANHTQYSNSWYFCNTYKIIVLKKYHSKRIRIAISLSNFLIVFIPILLLLPYILWCK